MVLIVTGGIGSGKSEVCRILRDNFGYQVYEADVKAKELYSKFPDLIESIETSLACRIRNECGEFVPSLLAERIFTDKEALAEVENILFPYMLKDFDDFCKAASGPVIMESATVLEKSQFDGIGDAVILVDEHCPIDSKQILHHRYISLLYISVPSCCQCVLHTVLRSAIGSLFH